jgi:uncharacterized membrane-anchored protein
MIIKLLVTILVIGAAIFALKRRQFESPSASKPKLAGLENPNSSTEEKSQLQNDLRVGAYLFVAFIAGIGGVMYYMDWQDDHTVLTINLIRDAGAAPVTYLVYKYQLQDKSFVTIDGKTVTVASNERMEIEGLEN